MSTKTIERLMHVKSAVKLGLNQQQFWSTMALPKAVAHVMRRPKHAKPVRELLLGSVEQINVKAIKQKIREVIEYLKGSRARVIQIFEKSARKL